MGLRMGMLAMAMSAVLSCSSERPVIETSKTGMIDGEVVYVDMEGGFFGILCGADKFSPVVLPDEFKKDGLKIRFKYRRTKDRMSTTQWGTLIEVTVIEKR